MARKKWAAQTEITPSLLKFREKKRWQIALRRYVIEKNRCPQYAPYFGLDIELMRKWFEMQFEQGLGWNDFGKNWQFEHILPVSFFDFSKDAELKLCWHFVNIRVGLFKHNKEKSNQPDLLAAITYFQELYNKTQYRPCLYLLEKARNLELSQTLEAAKQQDFITANKPYLDTVANYSSFEFELLNSGRNIDEVIKEVNFLKKF